MSTCREEDVKEANDQFCRDYDMPHGMFYDEPSMLIEIRQEIAEWTDSDDEDSHGPMDLPCGSPLAAKSNSEANK